MTKKSAESLVFERGRSYARIVAEFGVTRRSYKAIAREPSRGQELPLGYWTAIRRRHAVEQAAPPQQALAKQHLIKLAQANAKEQWRRLRQRQMFNKFPWGGVSLFGLLAGMALGVGAGRSR